MNLNSLTNSLVISGTNFDVTQHLHHWYVKYLWESTISVVHYGIKGLFVASC